MQSSARACCPKPRCPPNCAVGAGRLPETEIFAHMRHVLLSLPQMNAAVKAQAAKSECERRLANLLPTANAILHSHVE